MAAEYIYRVSAWWASGRTGLAKCESAPSVLHFSEAPEWGGLEGRWTPEQLLLCALAASFTTTFQDVARGAKFEYTDLEVEVEGRVERNKINQFSEIVLHPRLTVHSEEEFDAGLKLLRKTRSMCLISRAVAVLQTLESRVEVAKPSHTARRPSGYSIRNSRGWPRPSEATCQETRPAREVLPKAVNHQPNPTSAQ